MNPIRILDAFLLARVFQPLVDLSQRQPVWWARQAAVLFLLAIALVGILVEWHWSVLLLLLVTPLFVWSVTASPAVLAMFGSGTFYRRFNLVLYVSYWSLRLLLPTPLDTTSALSIVSAVAWTAFVYFASCRPPAPPKPRTRAAPRTAWGGA